MNATFPRDKATPRYDSLYDKRVLANWIALIADDRDLDPATIATLSGLDEDRVRTILDGRVSDLSVELLDATLRAVERRPARCGNLGTGGLPRPLHVHGEGVAF